MVKSPGLEEAEQHQLCRNNYQPNFLEKCENRFLVITQAPRHPRRCFLGKTYVEFYEESDGEVTRASGVQERQVI